MSIDVKIKDGKGRGHQLSVDGSGSAMVTDLGIPPENSNASLKPFSILMTDKNGSSDMLVDGSVTEVDFTLDAPLDGDRYIHTIAFTIADAQATLGEFANFNNPLTNGCQLIYQDSQLGDVILAEALKTNFDFVQLCNFEPMFGTGSDAFRAANVEGASEAFIPILDIEDVFGMRYGIRLPQATTKKLILRVRDNLTGADRMDVRVYGFDRIKHD